MAQYLEGASLPVVSFTGSTKTAVITGNELPTVVQEGSIVRHDNASEENEEDCTV